MAIIKNPEVRGVIGLVLIILAIGLVAAALTGRLEQWLHIDLFSGPRALDKIVLVSERSGAAEVYLMDPDGSKQKQLTDGARVLGSPVISPKGDTIVFTAMSGGSSQLFSVGAGGGTPRALTASSSSKDEPGYSPNGSHLSFASAGKVYVADPGGENPDPVLPSHEELHRAMMERRPLPNFRSYAWGPNGSMVGISRDENGNESVSYVPQIEEEARPLIFVTKDPSQSNILVFVPNLEEQQPRRAARVERNVRVAGVGAAAGKPVFAITLAVDGRHMLWLFDGTRNLVAPVMMVKNQELGRPAVAPDASMVVFAVRSRDPKEPSGLVRFDMESGQGGLLAAGRFENPTFSPKGDRILAVRVNGAKRDIVVISAPEGELKQLTTDGKSYGASWTPASKE